jgi:hypothetical protein
VTDAGVRHLRGLSKLKHLSVQGTNVSEEAMEKLRHRIP